MLDLVCGEGKMLLVIYHRNDLLHKPNSGLRRLQYIDRPASYSTAASDGGKSVSSSSSLQLWKGLELVELQLHMFLVVSVPNVACSSLNIYYGDEDHTGDVYHPGMQRFSVVFRPIHNQMGSNCM